MATSFVSSEDGEGGKLFDGASMAEVRSHVIECILMLINALVGFPDELRHRVQLRAEFIRLQLLDVLGALHRERQVELVRQVEIFESEMIEDTDEIAQLPNLGAHHGAHLDQSGQAELAERTAAAHLSAVVGNALEAAVSSPLQLLQEKVLTATHQGALPKLLALLRALYAVPDTALGLHAWSVLENLVDATVAVTLATALAPKATDEKEAMHAALATAL
ncbi:hypothetical protein Ctob_014737, partial [Chrysochromulina tobinii]